MAMNDPYKGDSQALRAHTTPDPEQPPQTVPVPDDMPDPVHAPVEEPVMPEPPIRAQA